MRSLLSIGRSLIPHLGPTSPRERVRASVGALVGLLVTGFVAQRAVGSGVALPLLIAPMGASAVLLFAVPASPLAQPWSILGGNLVAALVGVTAARWIADPVLAASLSCAVAIALMLPLRCLHPPSGAVALTAVLGGPVVHASGYRFVLWPVALDSVLLLAAALLYNNITGRRYPHRVQPAPSDAKGAGLPGRIGFTAADLEAVLAERDELIDVDPADLRDIVDAAEARAYGRRFREITCEAIMASGVVSLPDDTPVGEARRIMVVHRVRLLPVTGPSGALVGVLTPGDFFRHARWADDRDRADRPVARMVRRSFRFDLEPKTVRDIMTTAVESVAPDARVADLVPLMAGRDIHTVPVVAPDGRILGVVTQSQVIAALFRGTAGRPEQATA